MNITVMIGKCSLPAFLALSPAWTAPLFEAEELHRETSLVAADTLDCAFVVPGSEDSESAMFEIRTKKSADHVKVHVEKGAATFAVHSPSGIGSATITLVKEQWPETVVVRFHLHGLESFSISHGKMKLAGSVVSHSGNPSRLYLSEDGEERKLEPGSGIRVFDARGKPAKGLPGEGGYFEIVLPETLFEGRSKSLTLQWIDFYRG